MGTISGTRRQARERALALLYEAETRSLPPAQVVAELDVAPTELAATLVSGVGEHCDALDEVISRFARGWTIDRMPALDRALLRIGTYELLHTPDVPVAVILSEAVELAQQYSTDDSGRFVNGVLAGIAAEARPAAPAS